MTEKNYNQEQREMKTMKKQEVVHQHQEPQFHNKKETSEVKAEEITEKIEETGKGEIKESDKKPVQQKPKEKPKKTQAMVNAFDIPVSTKHSAAICRFIKRKKIQEAIKDLEQVAKIKKPVPMKGEIPHRHGKGMMSGRFPEKAAREFIILLKSLSSNSIHNELENPIIVEAVANIGSRPFGRHGIRRKRTHIKLVAENKKPREKNA